MDAEIEVDCRNLWMESHVGEAPVDRRLPVKARENSDAKWDVSLRDPYRRPAP